MSNDWDLHCRTCKEDAGFENLNHKGDQLADLWKDAETFASAAELAEKYLAEVQIEADFNGGSIYTRMPDGFFSWCKKHLNHDVVPVDEYGRFYDRCNSDVWAECGRCRLRCELKKGHDGPHVFENYARNEERKGWKSRPPKE